MASFAWRHRDSHRNRMEEQRALYAAARGEAFAGIDVGGQSSPNLRENLDRQAGSESTEAVSLTSQKSAGVHPAEGDSLASAPPEKSTAGRPSQSTNFIDRPPAGDHYSTPVSEAATPDMGDFHPSLFDDIPGDEEHNFGDQFR